MKELKLEIAYDATLKEYIKDNISRKFARHLKNMNVLYFLNDIEVKNYCLVSKGDILKIVYEQDVSSDINYYDIPLDILYECEEYIIINKPSGLKTIPTGYNDFSSLYNALLLYYKKNNKQNTIHFINRLDKDTEGILIVAKDKYSALVLSKMLDNINRYYLALVEGVIEKDGTIEAPIKKDNNQKRVVDKDGKESITTYKVLKKYEDKTLLELKLYTGRCHQIRVHLSYIGHPIVGDVIYGSGCNLHLCSYKLNFIDPFSNKEMNFEIKPSFGG